MMRLRPVLVLGWLCVLALVTPPASTAGQQVPGVARPVTVDTLTAEQRALMRLRGLSAVAQPDTAMAPADPIQPQGLVLRPGVGPGAEQPRSGAAGIQRDSVMERLLGVGGYLSTEYRGAEVHFFADTNRLELRGNPAVSREGNLLVADSSIIYRETIALACGYGSPVLYGADMTEPLASDTVCFDVARQVGRAVGARTRVQEGATWNVACDAYFVGDQLYCHDAIFTDCDEEHPHYHFGAGQLKAIRGNVIVARNVTLSFADVPVFWLPFMVQSLSRGRRSGILMPRFGINDIARTSARYNRRIEDVGFYFAINDYLGAEIAMDWMSDNWTGLRGSFDYRWARQFLNGGLTYRQFWRAEGGREFTLASSNAWQPDERTQLSLTANYTTSSRFIQQRTFDPRELNRSIDSYGSLRRRFDWGSASVGVQRRQFLSDNTVNSQLPNLNLSLSPITLFEALPGEESWYSNLTWQGGGDMRVDRTAVGAGNTNPQAQSRRQLSTNLRSGLNLGRLSWGQSFGFSEQNVEARTVSDTLLLPGSSTQRGRWSSNLSFEQRLVGTSTFTPGLTVAGDFIRSEQTGQTILHAPTRVDLSSALRMEMFGFWPGLGPFERMRHRVSPSITYNYSPAAQADSLQRAVFGAGIAEQNRISLGLTQTFEAKYRARPDARRTDDDALPPDTPAPVLRDGALDTAAAAVVPQERRALAPADTLGGRPLQRRQQVATVSLLAISTEALVYDFVQAREGFGLQNTQLRNSLQSDLLRGLQISLTHDLFRPVETGAGAGDGLGGDDMIRPRREFAPHLREVNASFSLNANSWLFRVLRLGRQDTVSTAQHGTPLQPGDPLQAGPSIDRTDTEYGLIGTSRRTAVGEPRGTVGSWNASVNYTLLRPRTELPGVTGNQMVTGNLSFQPTEFWTVRWNTGYSFTARQFSNHILTLTRTLHDWDANFDFVKAQNGNFSMQFRVHLRANPDVKLDYSQQDVRGLQTFQ